MISDDKIEFLVIGLVFAFSIILTLIGFSMTMFIVTGLLTVLAIYYIKSLTSDKIALVSLGLYLFYCILFQLHLDYSKLASSLFFLLVIFWVVFISIKHSREYQSLELVELSVGILLALFVISQWVDLSKYGLPQEGVMLILPFAICFSIGTLMYSSNLWMRYTEGLKKVLTIVLVHVLSQLLIQTIKNVSL